MIIEVSKNDIDLGKPDPEACPVQRGIARAVQSNNVWVWNTHCYIGEQRYDLPVEVCRFIDRFDRNELVQPFSFYLPIGE